MVLKRVWLLLVFLLVKSFCFAQETLIISSDNLKTTDTVWVYKPANYLAQKKQKYPVLYLLHGHGGNYQSWSTITNLQKLADEYQFLIVCPDGLKKSWYINSPQEDSTQYETFFIRELMPAIARKYAEDPTKTLITGNSMGGYGAMWLFLKHPDLFLSAGSTSGVLNLRYSANKKTLSYLLGDYDEENALFDDYSPVNLLENIAGTAKQIIFDSGTEDYLYITSQQFRQKCDELKIKATYIAQPGAHTGSYWSKSILQQMQFFKTVVDKQVAVKKTVKAKKAKSRKV